MTKIEHANMIANKARKCESFIGDEAAKMGFLLTFEQAAIFSKAVISFYGNNTPPAPVEDFENIGSM